MHDSVPRTRAGFIIWDLLLRHWGRLGGATTAHCSQRIGLTWEGTHSLLTGLAACTSLPVFQEGKLWWCDYSPRDFCMVQNATPTQQAALVAHRLICRGLFDGNSTISEAEAAYLTCLDQDKAVGLLIRLADNGGLPLYDDDDGVWFVDLHQFDQIFAPDRANHKED